MARSRSSTLRSGRRPRGKEHCCECDAGGLQVAREAALRQQVESQCTTEGIVKLLEQGGSAAKSRGHSGPRVFEISAPCGAEDAEADVEGSPAASDDELQALGEGNLRSTSADFWEDSLDVVGVIKCGLCGLRFPLSDRPALEAHYSECEAAVAQSRQPGQTSPPRAGRFTGAASSPHGSDPDDVLGPALY
mmetsp:Transcript_17048/g.34829  ORF Transcript_17048/g.34829 Transcript_17048/m.34829 type:complete len:191 (-) Transcript_17048:412-984(-)